MNSQDDQGVEECFICRRRLVPDRYDRVSVFADDEQVGEDEWLPVISQLYALVEAPQGDICVCGDCYTQRCEASLPADARAEIHYEFGLEYLSRGDRRAARLCFERAVLIARTSHALAALATVEDDPEMSLALNCEALQIDPDNSQARYNLDLALNRRPEHRQP